MEEFHALQPVLILLLIGIVSIAVMRPLRMSPIVGYLLAGMLIGEHGLGWIEASETTHLLAELGVVFLLFDIGLHFSLGNMWDARKDILGLGPIQMLLGTIGFGAIAWSMGISLEFSIIIATTLALSSTAVAAQILADSQQQQCPVAISSTAVLIFQDICAIFLLILASSMGNSEISLSSVIGAAAFKALLAFLAAIFIGRYLIGPLFKLIALAKDNEIFTATALLIVLATAAATGLFGLSLTLGAFLAGMIISETPYRHVIQTEVKPFRGLLLGFFFITVGMALDIQIILHEWWKIVLVAVLLIAMKTIFIYLAARLLRTPARNAVQMGVLLSQGSEFAFVIFAIPSIQNELGQLYSAILIIAIAMSMALTPVLVALARKIVEHRADQDWQKSQTVQEGDDIPQADASVIIVGMGEIGCCVANGLNAHNIMYRGIEFDHDCFVNACSRGYAVGFGDATDLRLMETINMSQADMIIITFANYNIAKELAPIVLNNYQSLTLIISVKTKSDKKRFEALGMQAVVQHSFPKGLDIAAAVLQQQQVPKQKIQHWMQSQQSQELDENHLFEQQINNL
jgi:CPA2 family monovalent cation:H+ antiporter-2